MVFKLLLFFLISLLHSQISSAELRDPTKPAYYSSNNKIDYTKGEDLKLSSIWVSGRSKRATINGVTAKQGEIIFSDVKIIKILNDSVLIKQNNVQRKLYLLTRSFKKNKTNSHFP
ncbi:MAG: hypothetical protein ACKE51_01290 [Methylococcaceae bacterium]